MYGVDISAATISTITEKVWPLVEACELAANSNRPLALLAVAVLVVLTLVVDGRFKYTNKACLFVLTAVSSFALFIPFEQVLPVILSFLLGAGFFGIIILVVESRGKKKVVAGAAH